MTDETHRRFYSGRFGAEQPAAINTDFNVTIEGSKSVSSTPKKQTMNADQQAYQEDIKQGKSLPGMEGE